MRSAQQDEEEKDVKTNKGHTDSMTDILRNLGLETLLEKRRRVKVAQDNMEERPELIHQPRELGDYSASAS